MKKVDPNVNFVDLEKQILTFWDENQSFSKLVEKNREGTPYRFIDGPITANNPMGVHHAWGRSLKDIFLRYKAHHGHHCHYQNGFDCQGLWVEVEVEKEHGFHSKRDIENFGLDQFSKACRERVEKYSAVQTEQSKRLGQWMDWDNSYYTHRDSNILGIWHFLRICHEKGWLYTSKKPMPWCSRCGTSLSEHEMAGSYTDMSHLSVYLKIPLHGRDERMVVWTTTPWTLAANVAMAVHPDLTYCSVKYDRIEEPVIICKEAMDRLRGERTVLEEMKGSDLVGLTYDPFLPGIPAQEPVKHKVVPWEEIDPQEGSGVVHIAPGCGTEDFELGKQIGLDQLSPVDESGIYTEGYGWLTGKKADQVAEEVAETLDREGKLVFSYMYDHSYPICWRCKDPLIFRLNDDWFLSTEEARPDLKRAAAEVQWQPEHMGKRMQDWLFNMGDWCISRKRFWGLPLPFYPCRSCNHLNVIGSLEELKERAVDPDKVDSLPELHRPWIDEIQIKCGNCSETVSRITDVGDCWLDAGIVPYSTRGFFEDQAEWEKWYPVEWVCEMREQVRLWFYSMLFMGVTLHNRSPYERVLTYERVLAEDGSKFSKTGFMIQFHEAAEKMGVDTIRYSYARANPANDVRFGYELGDAARRRLIAFWNIYAFFVTYARLDMPDLNGIEFRIDDLDLTDRWLLARLSHFHRVTTEGYENYNTSLVIREFDEFVEDVSNFYVRNNRRRFWMSDQEEHKRLGYWMLYQALKTCAVTMSPILPFLTEEMWQNAVRSLEPDACESVHHSAWPAHDPAWSNEEILKQVATVREINNLALRLRNQSQIKVRQPLATLHIIADEETLASADSMKSLIQSEINVKELALSRDDSSLHEERVALNFKAAGPVLKGEANRVKQWLADTSAEENARLVTHVKENAPVSVPGIDTPLDASIFQIEHAPLSYLVMEKENGVTLALDTRINDSLQREGWVRDILRHCQVLRKDAGLEVEDHIELGLSSSEPDVQKAIEEYKELIVGDTLADTFCACVDAAQGTKTVKVGGHEVEITLKKA